MIGRSLSFCVRDIASGKVKLYNVDKIVASTCYRTPEEFEYVLSRYTKTYWRDNPAIAQVIARLLERDGKIEQPRVHGGCAQEIYEREWWVNDV